MAADDPSQPSIARHPLVEAWRALRGVKLLKSHPRSESNVSASHVTRSRPIARGQFVRGGGREVSTTPVAHPATVTEHNVLRCRCAGRSLRINGWHGRGKVGRQEEDRRQKSERLRHQKKVPEWTMGSGGLYDAVARYVVSRYCSSGLRRRRPVR